MKTSLPFKQGLSMAGNQFVRAMFPFVKWEQNLASWKSLCEKTHTECLKIPSHRFYRTTLSTRDILCVLPSKYLTPAGTDFVRNPLSVLVSAASLQILIIQSGTRRTSEPIRLRLLPHDFAETTSMKMPNTFGSTFADLRVNRRTTD